MMRHGSQKNTESPQKKGLSREAEAVLALAEAGAGMLGGILDAIDDGAMIIDEKGTVLYCNRAMIGWVDVSSEEIIGQSIYDFVSKDIGRRRRFFFDKAARTGRPLHFQEEQKGKWFEYRIYPVLGDGGTVSSFAVYVIDITAQKNTEDRLRAGETLLREVLNALPVGVRVLDEKGELIRENPAAIRIWPLGEGHLPENEDAAPPDALRQHEEISKAALKGKTILDREIHLGPDALRGRTIIQSGLPLAIEGKGIIGGVVVSEDISQIRQGWELLRIQRDLAVSLGAVSDIRQALTLCLDAALRISGMDCGGVYLIDPRTGSVDLAVHRNLPDSFVSAVSHYDRNSPNARVVATGKAIYSTFREMKLEVPPGSDMTSLTVVPIRHDGKTVACLNLSSRQPDPPDDKIRVAIETVAAQIGGTIVRVRAEEERVRLAEVSANEELFRMLASNATVGIFLTDKQGRCRYVNDQWCRIAGTTSDRALGMGWNDAVHPSDKERLLAEWRATVRKGRTLDIEHRFLLAEGKIIWSAVSAVPIRGEKGRITGYVGTVTDITERKQAEEESRNQLSYLQAAREEERRKISREIHDELGQTLSAAKMELGLLSTGLLGHPDKFVEKVKSVRDLIDASIDTVKRVSAGLRPLVLDDLGLCSAIEWQAGELQKRTGIVCEVRVEPDNPSVDQQISTALFRILQEGLTNVVRHAQARRVSVSLSKEEKKVILKVSDNGKGISRENVQSPNSFGLIGMRERAHAYGGTFEIVGVPRRGTTLLVTIPLAAKEED